MVRVDCQAVAVEEEATGVAMEVSSVAKVAKTGEALQVGAGEAVEVLRVERSRAELLVEPSPAGSLPDTGRCVDSVGRKQ